MDHNIMLRIKRIGEAPRRTGRLKEGAASPPSVNPQGLSSSLRKQRKCVRWATQHGKKWTRRCIMKTMYSIRKDSFHLVLGILLSSYLPITCRNPLSFLTHTESCDGLQTLWSNPWSAGDGSKRTKKWMNYPCPQSVLRQTILRHVPGGSPMGSSPSYPEWSPSCWTNLGSSFLSFLLTLSRGQSFSLVLLLNIN